LKAIERHVKDAAVSSSRELLFELVVFPSHDPKTN
jgi:hypothetical protein